MNVPNLRVLQSENDNEVMSANLESENRKRLLMAQISLYAPLGNPKIISGVNSLANR